MTIYGDVFHLSALFPAIEKGRIVGIGGFDGMTSAEKEEDKEVFTPRGRIIMSVNEYGYVSAFMAASKQRMFSLDICAICGMFLLGSSFLS
jgi:hypothetical protein